MNNKDRMMETILKWSLAMVLMTGYGLGSFAEAGKGDEEGKTLVWNTDLEQSKQQAKESGKLILLSFSGSDWCGACIRLDRALFQSEEFKAFAPEKFVLLNADFPMKRKNRLSDEQTAHNEELASKFNKKGELPTVVVLNAEGQLVATMKYPRESTDAYLNNLKSIVKEATK